MVLLIPAAVKKLRDARKGEPKNAPHGKHGWDGVTKPKATIAHSTSRLHHNTNRKTPELTWAGLTRMTLRQN